MNVVSHNYGGILVASEDCHGFVPISHLIDMLSELAEDDREQYLSSYLDRKVSLKVIECDPVKERIVFSERAALAKKGKRNALLHDLKEDDIIKGVVTNIAKFCAFVDLGGLEGLIHISSMNFPTGCTHIDEFLYLSQPVKVCILNIDAQKCRLGL